MLSYRYKYPFQIYWPLVASSIHAGKYFARYKQHQYYSVQADELSDTSNKEQMLLLVLRFADKNLEVPERF